jgi:Rhs element Vgr protein
MASKVGAVTIKVKAGGKDYANPGVTALAVTHQANTISFAELVLFDGDVAKREFKLSNDPNFAPGKEVELELGHGPDDVASVFKGIIVRHQIRARQSGGTSLVLEIKHAGVKMSHVRKTRHFIEKKDSDIIETLIKDHSLTPRVDSDFKVEHERMIQYNLSDWDFMILRAEANGKLVYTDADGKTVNVAKPEVKESGAIKATFGDNIYEFEAECESRDEFSGGSAISWDHSSQQLLDQSAESPSAIEEKGVPKGSDLATSLGEGTFRLRHPGELGDKELIAWGSSKLLRSLLSKLRGRVQLHGDAKLKPGGTLMLEGLSTVFNGPAFISAVRHHVLNGHWLTDVELGLSEQSYLALRPDVVEPPVSGLAGPMRGLQVGVVKEIKDDPAGFFRVLVKMPVVDDTEDGIWCRVAHPDAGASHTLFFQPAVGDEVVLGFLDEDPRHAIVLGSLHNKDANKPPIEGNEEYKKKGIVTVEGLKITFNDEDKSIIIETPAGKKVTLDEKEDLIQLEDDHNNKLILNADGITLESGKDIILKATGDISVEGVNIEQSAQAQFKAEGTAGIEVSSSANAVLKGAMVQIN